MADLKDTLISASLDSLTIQREALGRIARLGELYDIRRDAFCGVSVVQEQLPHDSRLVLPRFSEAIKTLRPMQHAKRALELINDTDLQISVLADLLPLHGSALFLKSLVPVKSTVHSFIYNITTEHERLNLRSTCLNVAEFISKIDNNNGTHVLIETVLGANCVASIYCNETDSEEFANALSKLEAFIRSTDWSSCTPELASANLSDYCLKWYLDIIPENEKCPETLQEIPKFIQNIKTHIQTTNGIPILYKFLPISEFLRIQKCSQVFQIPKHLSISSTDKNLASQILQFFIQMYSANQHLTQTIYKTGKRLRCFKPAELDAVARTKYKFQAYQNSFLSSFSELLLQVRSVNLDISNLQNLLESYKSRKNISIDKIFKLFEYWKFIKDRIRFAELISNTNAKYIGLYDSFEEELLAYQNDKVYALYFSDDAKSKQPDQWFYNKRLFLQMLETSSSDCKFCVVDCDIHQQFNQTSFAIPCIRMHISAKTVVVDELTIQGEYEKVPLACVPLEMFHNSPLPFRKINFETQCGGNTCNYLSTYHWVCPYCENGFQYGYDKHVYCDCGKVSVFSLKFKCPDKNHGPDFLAHQHELLEDYLKAPSPNENINILLLGETGVGKSTWINSLINYVSYESLDEALSGNMHTLITSKLIYSDESFNEVNIITEPQENQESNECFIKGQSATQKAKVHQVPICNVTYNFIDTPGIGDTRGVLQDNINFENILNAISYYDEIHAICIMLKPDGSRLSMTFRYCISELLTRLHRDAIKNIMFCFTNCRATSYRPGDTLVVLKELLDEIIDVKIPMNQNTVYCLDNEAFRYLAATKHNLPIVFSDAVKSDFSSSWAKSRKETFRMLRYASKLPVHFTQNTFYLNRLCKLVTKLAPQLAEISEIVQTKKSEVERAFERLTESDKIIEELTKQQTQIRTELVPRKHDFARTVCLNKACTKITEVRGIRDVEYVAVCHDKCSIPLNHLESSGTFMLKFCKQMNLVSGVCKKCNHSYKDHHHTFYENVIVSKEVKDSFVTEELKHCKNVRKCERKKIARNAKRLQEYEVELKQIEETALCFASFLGKYTITANNVAMKDYLNQLILEEKYKTSFENGNQDTLNALCGQKVSYEFRKLMIMKGLEKQESFENLFMDPDEIQNRLVHLQNLHHFGKYLKNVRKC